MIQDEKEKRKSITFSQAKTYEYYDAVLKMLSENPARIFLVYGVDGQSYFYVPEEVRIKILEGWEHNEQGMCFKKTEGVEEKGLFCEYTLEHKIGIVEDLDDNK